MLDEAVEVQDSWTDEEVRIAVAMWTKSEPSPVIAKVLSKTRNAVIGKMHRINCVRGVGLVDYTASNSKAYLKARETAGPPQEIPVPPSETPAPAPIEEPVQAPVEAPPAPVETPSSPPSEQPPAPPVEAPQPLEAMFDAAPKKKTDAEWIEGQTRLPGGIGLTPRPMRNLVDVVDDTGIPFLSATLSQCHYPLWADVSRLPVDQKRVCGKPTKGITTWCEHHYGIVFEPPRKGR
jgi:hypothetical protein